MYVFFRNKVDWQGFSWFLMSVSLFVLYQCADGGIDKGKEEDPYYKYQWHLNDPVNDVDINAPEAWKISEGEGITVAVNDDGTIVNHPDLADNHRPKLSFNFVTKGIDPDLPWKRGASDHGTLVAGLIIGVSGNGKGIRGVAPKSKFFALNILEGKGVVDQALSFTKNFIVDGKPSNYAVSNNSWGPIPAGGWGTSNFVINSAWEAGLNEGFGGKGVSYLFAAGNDRHVSYKDPISDAATYYRFDDLNYAWSGKHYGVMQICAISSFGKISFYSTPGATLWVCGPSSDSGPDGSKLGLTTTDKPGEEGYNAGIPSLAYPDYRDADYTSNFGGTSGAAPIVSGVVALIRSANKELTWRDVKLILAATSRKVDPAHKGWFLGVDSYDGTKSGSERYSGKKYNHSHDYGFGLADAGRAVKVAQSWQSIGAEFMKIAVGENNNILVGERNISDNDVTGRIYELTVSDPRIDFIEFVSVNAWFEGNSAGDLRVELTSPAGMTSVLAEPHACFYDGSPTRCSISANTEYDFSSARHLGEDPNGVWTLRVVDEVENDIHQIYGWIISVYGHKKD